MLPDIDGKETFVAFRHRRDRVGGLLNLELAIIRYQPNPAAAELRDTLLGEFDLERVEAVEVALKGVLELACRRAAVGR